ncbi:Helix-turn-helix domain-containing protein [Bacteroides luti]|uniref:Helix-turn-helix domain-containing protein n=1 Tax=Bacteroides luti TaxID=1297750 RepID=A0A1M4VIT1_9BACE|nr:helix-turn-helix domain-containing protein [Bacteroides luti]SHE68894.1 Helix-turn-helix domain-containing protein [Bacteroides luti]
MEEKERAAGAATVGQDKDSEKWLLPESRKRLLSLFLSGEHLSSVDIVRKCRIADPRSEIRHLRNAGYEIKDRWMKSSKSRYKIYFMETQV